MGHLRRCTSIAVEMRRQAPEVAIGLLTNAPVRGMPEDELTAFSTLQICPRPDMSAWLTGRRDVQAVAVDTAVVDGIAGLEAALAIILRETPRDRQARFALPDGRAWDLLIVPNPADHWIPDPQAVPARRTEAVGWIYRATPPMPVEARRPTVLVASGGGGTAETTGAVRDLLDPVLASARAQADDGFEVVQALGPRAPADARLAGADRTVDPGGELNRHFATADVVISTAGYNSVLELAALDVPAMLVAIPRSIDDQPARARLWGARLGCCLDANSGAENAASWLAGTAMARQRRRPWNLGPSGAAAAAGLLLGLGG